MVTVKNNDIVMTRGDSLNVKVAIVKNKSASGMKGKLPDSRELIPAGSLELANCEIWFAMSRFFPGQVKYKLLLKREIPTSTLGLCLTPEDTKDIPIGIYNYDIKLITHPENSYDEDKIDTFISGEIQLVGECDYHITEDDGREEGTVNDYIHEDAANGDI